MYYKTEAVVPEGKTHDDIHELSDGEIQTGEESVEFRTGTRRIWKTKFPVHDADGDIWAIGGICMDITEKLKREQELSDLAKKNEQLLVEMNHRVANNLANVQALARIELSADDKSKEESINDLINRIRAVGIIHDKLYRTREFSHINTAQYIEELAETIITSFSNRINTRRCRYAIDDFPTGTGLLLIKEPARGIGAAIEISTRRGTEFRFLFQL